MRQFVLAAAAILSAAAPAHAQKKDLDAMAKSLGLEAIRGIDYDICYPADAAEYQALGKNAIIMLEARSGIATELPLRAVYLTVGGVRVPLQKLLASPLAPADDGASQISFYLIPIQLMKRDARLQADFAGERRGFEVAAFSSRSRPDSMPRFALLDDYDSPTDADMPTVGRVIAREYPQYIDGAPAPR